MNVQQLNKYLAHYKGWLKKQKPNSAGYYWESFAHFQQQWDVDAPDFAGMYDSSLQNSQSKRLWKREAWEPKEMMLRFAQMQPEFVRRMFKDLFDEEKDIKGRISRFKFGMDAMLAEYKERHPRRIDNNHYHDDSEMIHLYLAFHFPEKYSLFHYPSFRKLTELLMVKNPPSPFETDRFFKITKIWRTFLGKDEELLEWHRRTLPTEVPTEEITGLVVFDFYRKCGQDEPVQ